MRKLCYSNGSPFARKVRIVLHEKGLDYEPDVNDAVRPIEEIQELNPNLAVPILIDGDLTLFESNLIIDYLLRTYPGTAPNAPADPPLAPSMTRPDRHWEDAKTLATIETFANSMVNLRLMAPDGITPDTSAYMARQATRVQRCLDWLERRATPEGFAPGWLSVMDIALICPLAYGEKRGVLSWRGRPALEAIYGRLQTRPSVAATPVNDWPPKSA
jgi:glutathione S-transferase